MCADREEFAGNSGLNVKKGVLNQMQLWYFADTLVDSTVKELLAPYVAQKVG